MGFEQEVEKLLKRLQAGDMTAVTDTATRFNSIVRLWVRDFTQEYVLDLDLGQVARQKILEMANQLAKGKYSYVTRLTAWLKRGAKNAMIDYLAVDAVVPIPRTSRKRWDKEGLPGDGSNRLEREDALRQQLREEMQIERFERTEDLAAEEPTSIADLRYADNRKNYRNQRLGIKRHNGRPMRRDRKIGEPTIADIVIDRGKSFGLRCNDPRYINVQIWRRFQKEHSVTEIAWHFNLTIPQVEARMSQYLGKPTSGTAVAKNRSPNFKIPAKVEHNLAV